MRVDFGEDIKALIARMRRLETEVKQLSARSQAHWPDVPDLPVRKVTLSESFIKQAFRNILSRHVTSGRLPEEDIHLVYSLFEDLKQELLGNDK